MSADELLRECQDVVFKDEQERERVVQLLAASGGKP